MSKGTDQKIARKLQRAMDISYTTALRAVQEVIRCQKDDHAQTFKQIAEACDAAIASGNWGFFGLTGGRT